MPPPIIAVDIGNSRIKLGTFITPIPDRGLPTPKQTLAMPAAGWNEAALRNWLADAPIESPWWIASVNRTATTELAGWLKREYAPKIAAGSAGPSGRFLAHHDLPIAVAVPQPEQVGIDRLAGAVAANRLRDPARPALVVHVGSAITVNLLSADGAFRGGAILPGIAVSARALGEFTDLLPHLPLEELGDPPAALGDSTPGAIRSGLYWGAVGAMRELIQRLSQPLPAAPEIFLTGGAAPSVAKMLDPQARYVQHLVLSGIALAKKAHNGWH